jgi:hypothetical protein
MAFEPLKGLTEMRVTEHRRKLEFAEMMRHLLDDLYPEVERIRLVVDDLNTHSPAAFYESFSAEEARRISKKIEFVYTPRHSSWLKPHGRDRALSDGETMLKAASARYADP